MGRGSEKAPHCAHWRRAQWTCSPAPSSLQASSAGGLEASSLETAPLCPRFCPGGNESRGCWEPRPTAHTRLGSIPHPPALHLCPGLWAGCWCGKGGRKEGRQAGSEALRGRGQGWAVGHQAQEVSPSPAFWPVTSPGAWRVTSPGAWRRFSLKLGSRLLPPRRPQGPRASLPPTPRCLVRSCPEGMEEAPAVSRLPGGGAPGTWGSAGGGPGGPGGQHSRALRRGRGSGRSVDKAGSLSPLPTDQAPPSCSGPWSWPPQRPMRHLSPQESPSQGQGWVLPHSSWWQGPWILLRPWPPLWPRP